MQNKKVYFLTALVFFLIGLTIYLNVNKQLAVDRSKIPGKVESSKGFQKWITNLKNKDFNINADEFRLKEENEIYNTKWIHVYSIDEKDKFDSLENKIKEYQDVRGVVFAPSNRAFIDFRHEGRDGYNANEIHYYGVRDNKIIDSRVVDCSVRANCYFDRAYFLDNDVFVISEFSRTIDKKDTTSQDCLTNQICQYSIKLHVIDLVNNSRLVYESKPFDIIWNDVVNEL